MYVKKILSVLLVICMLASAASLTVFAADNSADTVIFDTASASDTVKVYGVQYLFGDINGDEDIGPKDSRDFKKFLIGSEVSLLRLALDVNHDGEVSSRDSAALKKCIAGTASDVLTGNTTVEKSFDDEENAMKLSVIEANDSPAFFDLPGSDAEEGYFAIVLKNSEGCEINTIDESYDKYEASLSETVSGNNYNGYVFELSDDAVPYILEVVYDTEPEDGKEVFVDSVIYASSETEAVNAATERVEARNIDDGKVEPKSFTIQLDGADKLSLISASNHTTASYVPEFDAIRFKVTGDRGDPWAILDLEQYNLSADEYKYIVIDMMLPSSCHSNAEAEVFYSAGSITQPTATYSNIYSLFRDDAFHSTIFELTNATFWTGKIHSLRMDYFCDCTLGDSSFCRSITFCNTYEAAMAASHNKTGFTKDTRELFNYGLYHNGEDFLAYRTYVPYDYDGTKDYPVMMLLHGAGAEGYDATYHLTFFSHLFKDDWDPAYQAICIAPQCIKGCRWAETPWAEGNYSIANTPESRPMKAAISVLKRTISDYKVDTDRVYISGYSMGGFGTWDAICRYPDLFAAAVPICGGGDPAYANILKNIPIWTFHGPGDTSVPYNATKGMYDAIKAAGGNKITFNAVGSGHLIWDLVFDMDNVYSWLFSQKLSDRK